MLLALTAPADNPRGPRYMQEALAAVHQASRRRRALTLEYAVHDGWVGRFIRVPDPLASLVTQPLKAKYPNCTLKAVEGDYGLDPPPSPVETWTAELALRPDLFPILRHSQFEDLSSRGFEDPIDALLQAIAPDGRTQGRIQIHVRPTSRRRHRRARRAVAKLDLPRLRASDERMQRYARFIMHPVLWPLAWFATLRAGRTDARFRSQIDTTAGRHHEREDDVQAASDKVGGHLFDVRIRLVVYSPAGQHRLAHDRLRVMMGALGSFTTSRLATSRMPSASTRSPVSIPPSVTSWPTTCSRRSRKSTISHRRRGSRTRCETPCTY